MAKETSRSNEADEAARDSKRRMRTGVAVGIGSAAIVAALLYANRGRKSDRERS